MRFLIDAQLPKQLSDFLNQKGFDSIHTLQLPDANRTSDKEVNEICLNENRVLITKDNDFLDSFYILDIPEKLIIVTTGNIRNQQLIKLFETHLDNIQKRIATNRLLEISTDSLIVHL